MFGKQIMSTVSVTIVLLILGVFAVLAISAEQFTDTLKSRMGFTVVMNDAVSDNTIRSVEALLAKAPYVNSLKFTTAQETMEAWERDNGENIMDVLGVNPFGAEFEVTVTPPYANSDSLAMITDRLRNIKGIDEVSTTSHVVEGINRIMHFISVIFIPLAIALLLVSAVLINNTVRLTVYASRFLIHTMRLVGATGDFIRRPFIRTGILNGFVAGIAASLILWAGLEGLRSAVPEMVTFASWSSLAWLFPAMIAAGIMICGISAALATNKYLKIKYDDLF